MGVLVFLSLVYTVLSVYTRHQACQQVSLGSQNFPVLDIIRLENTTYVCDNCKTRKHDIPYIITKLEKAEQYLQLLDSFDL
jgi:hypothetical protein